MLTVQFKAASIAAKNRTAKARGEEILCSKCGIRPRQIKGRCKKCVADRHFHHRWGITREQYEEMLADQGGVCAICGCEETVRIRNSKKKVRGFSVDHDPETGKIRGVLCSRCNLGLGYFEDNQRWLRNAIIYLRR